jgi:hypothetical protein
MLIWTDYGMCCHTKHPSHWSVVPLYCRLWLASASKLLKTSPGTQSILATFGSRARDVEASYTVAAGHLGDSSFPVAAASRGRLQDVAVSVACTSMHGVACVNTSHYALETLTSHQLDSSCWGGENEGRMGIPMLFTVNSSLNRPASACGGSGGLYVQF